MYPLYLKNILISIFSVFIIFSTPVNATENALFFYNPESNINDFRTLKKLFDAYLTNYDSYQFQPFDNKNTFEGFLQEDNVFLLSSWHYLNLRKQEQTNLQPVLVGTINGNMTYTKVLSTKKNIININKLHKKRIASAGDKSYTNDMLQNMTQHSKVKFKVLTVPKDIDALMSIIFGMAQGALTSRHSLDTLLTLNPKKYQLLHQHAESEAITLPIVVAHKPVKPSIKKLLTAIENLSTSNNGKEILGMLGWNGWQKVNSVEQLKLGSSF
ncbi:PhnD/SsuA/transferrin family substrate-binding protein [Candidatus Halobeggiatoa sp. HSG11]|nr:PhnD/SsuA/transferrin family substrate-binding protein [Candidatus Halobeggiatoa sp. HSG11]